MSIAALTLCTVCVWGAGLALTQRGNNMGAYNYLGYLLHAVYKDADITFAPKAESESLLPTAVLKHAFLEEYTESLCAAVLLCWQISLHNMTFWLRLRWLELFHLFKALPPFVVPPTHSSALFELCKTIVLAANADLDFMQKRAAIHVDDAADAKKVEPNPKSNSIFAQIKSFFANRETKERISEADARILADCVEEAQGLLAAHMDKFRNASSDAQFQLFNEFAGSQADKFPSLTSLPLLCMNRSSVLALQPQQRCDAVHTLCRGYVEYIGGNFSEAAELIGSQSHVLRSLGLDRVERYLVDQTLVEAYLSVQDWHRAKLLLNERVAIAAGDAQAWIRSALTASLLVNCL
jgi:hypothetical protein